MKTENTKELTEEEAIALTKELDKRGEAIGIVISKVQTNIELLKKINELEDEPDVTFGEIVFELFNKHYPEQAKLLDAEICVSIGRSVEQLLSFNVNQRYQLDEKFETDYIKRYLEVFKDPIDIIDELDTAVSRIWLHMDEDIRFMQSGQKFFLDLSLIVSKGLILIRENPDDISLREKLRNQVLTWCNAKLDQIKRYNSDKYRKYEKFASVDYARRIIETWNKYITERTDYLDTEALNIVMTSMERIYRQLSVDDRTTDPHLIPVANVLHGLCNISDFQQVLLLGKTDPEQLAPIEGYLNMLNDRVESLKHYAEEPPATYTGK